MDARVYRVYVSCRKDMENTPEDWERALDAFRKIWTPENNSDVQECIIRLENQFEGQKGV